MYSFLCALNSFMWMCSMAVGLLVTSTLSVRLYFLASRNASGNTHTPHYHGNRPEASWVWSVQADLPMRRKTRMAMATMNQVFP